MAMCTGTVWYYGTYWYRIGPLNSLLPNMYVVVISTEINVRRWTSHFSSQTVFSLPGIEFRRHFLCWSVIDNCLNGRRYKIPESASHVEVVCLDITGSMLTIKRHRIEDSNTLGVDVADLLIAQAFRAFVARRCLLPMQWLTVQWSLVQCCYYRATTISLRTTCWRISCLLILFFDVYDAVPSKSTVRSAFEDVIKAYFFQIPCMNNGSPNLITREHE